MSHSNVLKITIGDDLRVLLKVRAQETGKSEGAYVKQILKEHMEDEQDLCEAEKRINEIEQGKSRTYTLKQAMDMTKAIHNGGGNC